MISSRKIEIMSRLSSLNSRKKRKNPFGVRPKDSTISKYEACRTYNAGDREAPARKKKGPDEKRS